MSVLNDAMTGRIDGTHRGLLTAWIELLRAEVARLRADLDTRTRPLTDEDLRDVSHDRALRRMLELERRQTEAIRILEGR